MNHFPDRRVELIARGGIISAGWLNALARAVAEPGNETSVKCAIPHLRRIRRGDTVTAEWLNRLADTLEKRFRETRTTCIGDAYYFRAANRRNFGRREFRRLRCGDAITAEWLNALVRAVNELNGYHVRDRYFYFERTKSVPVVETTHPWKVTAYVEEGVWMLKVNAACNFTTTASSTTNKGTFNGTALTYFARLTVPADAADFFVYAKNSLAPRAFANTTFWPLTTGNIKPWLAGGNITSGAVAVSTGRVPADFDGLLIATGTVRTDDAGEINGVELKQILRSDITFGMSCTGATA